MVTLKFTGLCYGVAGVGVAFIAANLGSVLQVTYTISGTMSGPLFGMFILSVFFPFVSVQVCFSTLINLPDPAGNNCRRYVLDATPIRVLQVCNFNFRISWRELY
jgi:hypothetical protein